MGDIEAKAQKGDSLSYEETALLRRIASLYEKEKMCGSRCYSEEDALASLKIKLGI